MDRLFIRNREKTTISTLNFEAFLIESQTYLASLYGSLKRSLIKNIQIKSANYHLFLIF